LSWLGGCQTLQQSRPTPTRRGKERELGGEGFVKALARVLGRRRTERRRRAWDTWKVREMGERE